MTDSKAPLSTILVSPHEAHPTRTAFVLHGVLGSARNWLSFMRRMAPRVPDWRFVLVDLRNHGDSHGRPPPHTLEACADDLDALAAHLGEPPAAVIGHSFGGKVALAYAERHGGAALRQCWVLDAVPGAVDPQAVSGDTHEVVDVVSVLRTLTLPITSRGALQETLRARGFGESFAGWMTTNLRPLDEGGFTWRFNLATIDEMLESYFRADFWPFLARTPAGLTVQVVRAERSDRWRTGDLARLAEAQGGGDVRLTVLPNAGHWLHVDNPDALMDLLVAGLNASTPRAPVAAGMA